MQANWLLVAIIQLFWLVVLLVQVLSITQAQLPLKKEHLPEITQVIMAGLFTIAEQ